MSNLWKELQSYSQREKDGYAQKILYDLFINDFRMSSYLKDRVVILITGTNGKSTVAKMVYRYLVRHNGGKVGLFISPHIFSMRERIQANGRIITADELTSVWAQLQKFCHRQQVIFFTAVFFSALLWFKALNLKYLVIECGIGARKDVTINLANKIGVITSIDFDHEVLLGNTLCEIAKNKVAVLKKKGILIVSENRRTILAIFNAAMVKAQGQLFNTEQYVRPYHSVAHKANYCIDFRARNSEIATKVVVHLLGSKANPGKIKRRMNELVPPLYNYFRESHQTFFYFCTAHNPSAVANSLHYIQKQAKIDVIIFSSGKAKNYHEILHILGKANTKIIILVNQYHKSIQMQNLEQRYHKFVRSRKIVNSLFKQNILVIGSHQLINIVLNEIRKP